LAIPVYVYVLFTTLIEVFNFNDGISVIVQDLIGSIGTIVINSVTLLFLYILKFYSIYVHETIELNKSKSSVFNSNDRLMDENKFKSKSLADIAPELNIRKNFSSFDSMNGSKWKNNSSDSLYTNKTSKWVSNSSDQISSNSHTSLWKSIF